jgi:hypothetical protein
VISKVDEHMIVKRVDIIPSSPLQAHQGVLQTFLKLDHEVLSDQECQILLDQVLASSK